MNQFLISFAVLSLFVYSSTGINVSYIRKASCHIDARNKSVTVYNMKNNCNSKELQRMFLKLRAGTFPPNGKLKGYVLTCLDHPCSWMERIWDGKAINYIGGTPPNDRGTVINTIFRIFNLFKATIYRTIAPIDGKEAFAIDYKNDIFTFLIVDYIRKVQKNLYLGIATIRALEKHPIVFFLLEAA